jgi:hypothetical protein
MEFAGTGRAMTDVQEIAQLRQVFHLNRLMSG